MNVGIEAVDWHGRAAWRLYLGPSASALITEHGAQLLSWTTADGAERLYLSPRSDYQPGAAIRGGIPVVFPQFGARGPLPKHGFARLIGWRFVRAAVRAGLPRVCFELSDSATTREIWPFAFRVTLELRLSPMSIEVVLGVRNTGDSAFDFTAALHTYLRATVANSVSIGPLERESLRVEGAIDRVYPKAPSTLTLADSHGVLTITQQGFPDTVVWNPGPSGAAAMDDMPADDWRDMLCVEAACVGSPRRLEPGRAWSGSQRLEATNM